MDVTMQHKLGSEVCVVGLTNFDASTDLGAPFKVTLTNGVFNVLNKETGKIKTTIENPTSLFKAVVRARVRHSRKLSGADLKFIRRVLGLQAKTLAKTMDISPEHLSRCEAGTKVLSGSSEKIFRMIAFASTMVPDPQLLMVQSNEEAPKRTKDEIHKDIKSLNPAMIKLFVHFIEMDIESVFDADDVLSMRFCLEECDEVADPPEEGNDDDKGWEPCPSLDRAA